MNKIKQILLSIVCVFFSLYQTIFSMQSVGSRTFATAAAEIAEQQFDVLQANVDSLKEFTELSYGHIYNNSIEDAVKDIDIDEETGQIKSNANDNDNCEQVVSESYDPNEFSAQVSTESEIYLPDVWNGIKKFAGYKDDYGLSKYSESQIEHLKVALNGRLINRPLSKLALDQAL